MELSKKVYEFKEELVKSTQEIIKIKSVEEDAKENMPFGEGISKTLDYALEISRRLGFKTKNLDGYVGYAEYGEGEDYIGVLGHLDVVPEGDGWVYPPYGAEIEDGKIYGRGTLDDKGPIMAALYGLKAIKDLNLPLSKKVRIIFGTNEETGSKELEHYLKEEKPPVAGFTPDAQYPLIYAEKGITIFDICKDLKKCENSDINIRYIKGGQRENMVPDYCEAGIAVKEKDHVIKCLGKFKKNREMDLTAHIKSDMVVIKSVGVSAHGSLPHLGKNAIMQMFEFLGTLPIDNLDVGKVIKFLNKYIGYETDGKSFGVNLEDEESGKLSFNLGTVEMNEDKISLGLNLRYPVTYKFEDVMNPFKETLKEVEMNIENMSHQEPLYFSKENDLVKTLLKVYNEQTGKTGEPLAIGGGTYAKEMPNILAFGPIFPGKPDLDHQSNEYIEIDDLVMNSKIYAHAIYELAK